MTTISRRSSYARALFGIVVVLVVSGLVVAGIKKLSTKEAGVNTKLPLVIATVPHIASWVESIGAGAIAVETLVPPGTEVHDFSFDPRRAIDLQRAVLLVANGAGLEEWLLEVSAAQPNLKIVESAKDIGLTAGDPHTWLDPLLAARQIQTISLELQRVVPTSAAEIAQATAMLVDQITTFDAETSAALSTLPNKKFVAFHTAFGYFARRYGLQQVGKLVERPGDEPTFADIESLSQAINDFEITTLFVEPGPVPDLAKALANEFNLTIAILDPLETIEPKGGTYLKGMLTNVKALSAALDKSAQ